MSDKTLKSILQDIDAMQAVADAELLDLIASLVNEDDDSDD